MRIIHIVSSVSKINFGIWNAAIFASEYLQSVFNVSSELWVSSKGETGNFEPQIPYLFLRKNQRTVRGFGNLLENYNRSETIIVTHGAWLLPTRLGFISRMSGFKWIYTPHGMFEPDYSSGGYLKKYIYYNLVEKRLLLKSDMVRAVSYSEEANLKKKFRKDIIMIYNGVKMPQVTNLEKHESEITFLFLARLQKKKGLIYLVKAWADFMYDHQNVKLMIAGPDEGELALVGPYIKKNIYYVGPVFNEDKIKLFKEAHYYVLPSYSEGFPTSVVEAMSYGCIPLISEGCNFPVIFTEKLGYEIKPDENSIRETLKKVIEKPFDNNLSLRNRYFVQQNLTEDIIGNQLYSLYEKLLKK